MLDNLVYSALGDVVQPWHWWALAAILIAIEVATPTFYFLWPGLAAALVGIILYADPTLSVDAQVILFSVLAVLSTMLWKRYAPRDWLSTEPHPTLNRRTSHYAGRRAKAAEDFTAGRGAVLIDDTRWSAVTIDGSDPASGEMVTVIGADGTILRVSRST
jgi:membrane protein implicated in regulation of membrane protease activity